jgi:serine/threonine protein phosphatase 1
MKCFVSTLPENKNGRDFIVGDIHGNFELLEQALDAVHLNPGKDRVIATGDLINKGPQSERCLEFLGKPWFFSVRGNHEALFMTNLREGVPPPEKRTDLTKEYLTWAFNLKAEKIAAMCDAFNDLPVAIELATTRGAVGIVHADIPLGMNWQTFKDKINVNDTPIRKNALLGRERLLQNHHDGVAGIGRVYFGHTPNNHRQVHNLGNCFYLDTGAIYWTTEKDPFARLTLVEAVARKKTLTKSFAPQNRPGIQVLPEHNKTLTRFRRAP